MTNVQPVAAFSTWAQIVFHGQVKKYNNVALYIIEEEYVVVSAISNQVI